MAEDRKICFRLSDFISVFGFRTSVKRMIQIEIKADSRYPVDKKKIRQQILGQLKRTGIDDGVVVSVAVVGLRKMKQLSLKFLKDKEEHVVLSFPQEANTEKSLGFVVPAGENLQLGDIVIAYPWAMQQAITKNILVDEEIGVLLEHGLRHLLGENHD